ncbi:MAG: hypothetical protein KIT84_00540 [Labilithrix sp.]|nr:hypothetical protein [Labilithrix sp.]MCW5809471.1 hypothetical protein [Labilithrix sp.]
MTTAYATGSSSPLGSKLPGPLLTASDMAPRWSEVELDFDAAAQRVVEAHEADGRHHDLSIPDLRTWCVAPTAASQFALVPLARHHEPMVLRANAFNNLMARLGAPSEFVRKLPAPLALSLIGYLMLDREEGKAATLRLRGNQIAAVVSDRYRPLDAAELMETIRAGLTRFGALHDVRVRGVATGLIDNLRLVFPSEQVAAKVGDVSMLSLDVTTSSFARSSVKLVPGCFRLACLNGLLRHHRSEGLAFRHLGDGLREAVAEGISSALVHARGVLDQWRRSVEFMITSVADQIEALRSELTMPERKNLEAEILRETGTAALPARLPLFDVLNGITSSAKLAAPARRLEIEAVAGDLLARHVGRA